MNPNREEALFALALEKLAEKRPAFLDAVREGDTALCARLEALLAAHEQPETLLATQAETARPLPSSSTSLTLRTRPWARRWDATSFWSAWVKAAAAWSMSRSRRSRRGGKRERGQKGQICIIDILR